MIYSNTDPSAILAMERDRTGNYGENFYDKDWEEHRKCPVCGACNPDHYYIGVSDECVGCSECVSIKYEL